MALYTRRFRVMMMHLYLAIPRGTARGLAKKETEAPTEWSAQVRIFFSLETARECVSVQHKKHAEKDDFF